MNRTTESVTDLRRMIADTARLSLAASVGCFSAAGLGLLLNPFAPDAIPTEGLAVVGCFYLAIGAIDYFRAQGQEEKRQTIVQPTNQLIPFTDRKYR